MTLSMKTVYIMLCGVLLFILILSVDILSFIVPSGVILSVIMLCHYADGYVC